MGINEIVKAFFDGYKDAKQSTYYDRKFEEIKKTNRLFEVDELNDLLDHAEDKEEYESILDHMYNFDATERGLFGYYKGIENKIIDKYWED